MDISEWLKEKMEARGVNPTTLAQAINENQPTILRIASGETKNPRTKILKKLENYFGETFSFDINQARQPLGNYIADTSINNDLVEVRRVEFKLSAGISGYALDYLNGNRAPIIFRKDWIDRRGYIADHLFAVEVMGQSMETSLYENDLVVVNTHDVKLIDGEVYAANYEGELVIKRLIREQGFWWLSSDNPDKRRYPNKQCDENCFIIGRIIHRQSERI